MNPYQKLNGSNFWKSAVADKHILDIENLWNPKFNIKPTDKISTYGSCFAQHIGRALKNRGFNWLITEKAPSSLGEELLSEYNYNVFSSRTGNIYTTSLLLQWIKWSIDPSLSSSEIWKSDERFIDPFRPRVEPFGFSDVDELVSARKFTLSKFRESIEDADFFVFTMGLTESWFNSESGYEYPMCPGTAAGDFDESIHQFDNQRFMKVRSALIESITLMRELNENLKFILTVSPVPLVATNENRHVIVSTMHSKSILRAVAGDLCQTRSYVDYFPSYEIINSPAFEGFFFEPNKRAVNKNGVTFVMESFFNSLINKFGSYDNGKSIDLNFQDSICEEEILAEFGADNG